MSRDDWPVADQHSEESLGILVIEDEALVARDIQSRLRQLGYDVVGLAHSPQQAIDLAEQTQPGLLLCDIHLKDDVDGIDVASTITSDRPIPVIFLTAYSDRTTITRAKTIAPYGYVLKPIETADLQIAIEMAMRKFSTERELYATRQLLATALQCIGDSLVFVDHDGRIDTMNEEALDLFGLTSRAASGYSCLDLLHERAGPVHSAALSWEDILQATAVTRLPPFQVKRGEGMLIVDGVVGPNQGDKEGGIVLILRTLAELQDPVESLHMPAELPADFNGLYDYPQDHERAFVLLLICPDQAERQLGKLSRLDQDQLIREIGEQLNLAMRSTDLATYYGGAVFSASLPYTTLEEASSIAGAILQRLSTFPFLDGRLELSVSIGLSHHRPGAGGIEGESPLELFRRANRSLTLAQQSGGNRVAIWRPSTDIGLLGNLDSQSDLLTADAGQDYRNMALLWNTMSTAASLRGTPAMAEMLVSRVKRSFNLQEVALYTLHDGTPRLMAADPAVFPNDAGPELSANEAVLVQASESLIPAHEDNSYSIPFQFKDGVTGVLYLRSASAEAKLRQQDMLLVQSLMKYVSGASETSGQASPARQARSTAEPELLFQSDVMAEVMELIRLIAPTDETVLITGESGTGKEVIAREIHRRSSRAEAPFVIVDCGAVVSTLIERELFGHVRGAFTGATHSAPGKLKDADGGTLLLDEIGELPLDLQVKLLRVVQDKQFTAVGSTRVETADTRIIAATNVDLEVEIRKGRFREDLYYRLNVFNVHSPPLRLREGDIPFLAQHFLEHSSSQYGRHISGFTAAAEEVMQRYPWPGNIRELRNKLIRAVILCQGAHIDVTELGLRRESDRPAGQKTPARSAAIVKDSVESLPEVEGALRETLASLVRNCLESETLVPLSQWLERDMILAALELHGQVNLQAAEALGLPESTLRRKLSRYRADPTQRPPEFQSQWRGVLAMLPTWIRVAQAEGFDPVQHLQNLLLSEIRDQAHNQATAATLAGVSPPTYRRQINQLADW
jgi:diguanylate cyclase (GGDEF)-like protein